MIFPDRQRIPPLDLFSRRVMAVASATGSLVGAAMISEVPFEPVEALREVTRKIASDKP